MGINFDFDMKFTDNPYIDLIVHSVKILGMNAVIKNENQALHYEDARSATESAKYMKYKEGNWNYAKDGDYSEASYMEWNSYYRMLNGLPPAYTLNDEKAYFEATGYDDSIYEDVGNAYIIPELYKKYFIDVGQYDEKFEGKYLHELNNEELAYISIDGGILDQIKIDYADDPHYQYIYHLGEKRIDFYTARKAINFSLLYIPKLDTFDIIENKFKRMYDRNRQYTMSTVYSEAYRFMSYHYDAFIQILIIIQTMVDMISEVQEYIINKDVFDSRTIRYLFESYGIAYYKEIPTKYQIRIIKNVNNLLKYKSSNKNIIDILELFDDDTITVYTYYLMKTKRINRDKFYYYTEDDINPKYNTNRDYYIGNPKDISNNKIPLTNVPYNVDDTIVEIDKETDKIIKDNFIRTYLYGYSLIDKYSPDIISNRIIYPDDYQPIASKFADSLITLEVESQNSNSFIESFLNDVAKDINEIPWFGTNRYNKDPMNIKSKKYLEERNAFLNKFKNNLANIIKLEFEKETTDSDSFALNQFHIKRIKYKLYGILGVFEYDKDIDFDNTSDEELKSRFYTADALITKDYCLKHNINYDDFIESDDKYILNHTIPFMMWYTYRESSLDYYNDPSNYIFNTNSSFSANYYRLGDLYEKYTKNFRENYIISVRVFIEAVFDKMAYDTINNPTPRYIGWMDVGYVISQTGKSLNNLELGDKVSTIGENNIPIYNSAYVYEVITEDMVGKEFYRKNYDLCFLKVPILDPNAYNVIEQLNMRKSYDMVTLADPFWDGVSTYDILTDEERDKIHQSKKQEILSKDFTIERTKYTAVDATIDLVKMSYQISYFMNMLYDKHKDEEALMVEVDSSISQDKVKLNDLLTFATALNFIYNGVEPDNIASDMEKNMYINGFNFDTDWNDIYNYLDNKYFINNNYNNEIHEYSYVDEYGKTITNTGYGMSPMRKGWMTELFDDFTVYNAGKDIKEFTGRPIYGYDEKGNPIFYYEDEQNKPDIPSKPIDPNIPNDKDTVLGNFVNYVGYYSDRNHNIPNPKIGAFLSGRYEQCDPECTTSSNMDLDFGSSSIWNYNLKRHCVIDENGDISTIDISWTSQYPDEDNNSHGLWLDTDILTKLEETTSDLEKINMLKKIYCSNTNLYNHLVYMMHHAESKRIYDIYKVLFDSFMETKINHDFYGLIDENGNPVYTNENNTSELYYISNVTSVKCDDNKFPLFIGYNLNNDTSDIYHLDYDLAISSNFTDCWYVNDSGDRIECLYNIDVFNKTGRKEYIIYETNNNELPRKYYMTPSKEGYLFYFYEITNTYLISKDNPDIKIPINMDEDGNIILNNTTKFVITYDNDTYTVTEVDKSTPILNNQQEIIITRKIADNYYDFLQYRNPALYAHLIDLKYNYKNVPITDNSSNTIIRYVPSDEKRKRIETICELIAESLEKYFDKKEWRFLFNLIPTANIQNIQNYIMKMVVFFKSWKTQVIDTSVSYVIDDMYNNHVHVIDDMYITSSFDNLMEKIRPIDYKYFENYTEYKTPIYIGEKVEMTIENYTEELQIDANGNIILP